jgi:hypothetical protein
MSNQEAQQALQDALIKTYFGNLEFLNNCDRELYERVQGLSALIDAQEYEERYELEFLMDNGEFDIYDTQTQSYIYHKNPKKINQKIVLNTNKTTQSSFGVVSQKFYNNNVHIDNEIKNLKEIQESDYSIAKTVYHINLFKEVLKETMSEKKEFEYIDKFLFLGTLLGRHIPNIVDNIKAKHYFVHESNLEIFRLSLFVLDYTILLKYNANITFSVMDEPSVLEYKFYQFLLKNGWCNHFIKFCTTNYDTQNSYDTILNAVSTYNPASFNYNIMLYNGFRNTCEKSVGHHLLKFPLKQKSDIFQNKPVMYVGAGPSLGDNIQWLQTHQNKFFIVTMGSAYKKLLNNAIHVDAIVTVESAYELVDKLQFDIESTQKLQDTLIFASTITHKRILERFNPEKLFLFNVMTTLKKDDRPIQGYSVGEAGYQILLELGVQELYLLGTDLAVHQQKGFTHDEESSSGVAKQHDISNIESSLEKGSFSDRDDLVEVKGNLEPKVKTTRNFNSSLTSYVRINKEIKTHTQHVYNLCTHGVFLEGTTPTKIEKVDVKSFTPLNIDSFSNEIKNSLMQCISMQLSSEEIALLLEQLEHTKAMKEYLNGFSDFSSYAMFKLFFEQFYKQFLVIREDSKHKNYYITNILFNFYGIITVYIEYCFNTKKLKKEKQKVQKVAPLFIEQMMQLIEDYETFLKKAIQ